MHKIPKNNTRIYVDLKYIKTQVYMLLKKSKFLSSSNEIS